MLEEEVEPILKKLGEYGSGSRTMRKEISTKMREVPPGLDIGSPQPLDILEPKIKRSSTMEKVKNVLKNITVEPIIMLLVAPRLLCNLTNENLNLQKACSVNLGFNDSICYAMVVRNKSGYTPAEEVAVQKVVSILLPYKQACHVLQLITMLLVSSLCERTKKLKPMFYIPFIGDISALTGYLICVYFFMTFSAEYSIFIEGILTVAFGGFPLVLAGSYSYIASITDHESRTVRIGAITLVQKVCMTLGIALSGYTYKYLGFYGVYLTALSLNILGVTYALITVKNIPVKDGEKKELEPRSCCYLVWNGTWISLCNSMKICFKKGADRRRAKMIALQLINFVAFGVMTAEYAVTYLYTRKKFGWDEVDFSIYKAYKTILELGGSAFVLGFCSRYLKWGDATIGIFAAAFRVLGTVILALSPSGLIFYIGTLTDLFSASALISVRSLITKVVSQQEQAMTNSISSAMDSVGLFIIGPLYSYIYYRTVADFPGAFYLCSAGFNVTVLILFYVLYRLMKQRKS